MTATSKSVKSGIISQRKNSIRWAILTLWLMIWHHRKGELRNGRWMENAKWKRRGTNYKYMTWKKTKKEEGEKNKLRGKNNVKIAPAWHCWRYSDHFLDCISKERAVSISAPLSGAALLSTLCVKGIVRPRLNPPPCAGIQLESVRLWWGGLNKQTSGLGPRPGPEWVSVQLKLHSASASSV